MTEKRREYYDNPRPEMLEFVPPSARTILDIGCGSGAFGAALKSRGAEVWGLEPSAAAEQAAERLDRVIQRPIEGAGDELPLGHFDCIVFNDVLEHFVDPWGVLRSARMWLAPEGRVVASIPNVRHLTELKNLVIRKNWDYADDGILDSTHLRFFTVRSIPKLFASSGYELVRIQGINGDVGWKFKLFNLLTVHAIDDTRYVQFACVATPARNPPGSTGPALTI